MPEVQFRTEPGTGGTAPAFGDAWRKRTLQLCCVTGFLSGAIGVFAGAILATALGITVRLPGEDFLRGRAQVPVQLGTRPRADGQGGVLQVRNVSPTQLRSVVIRVSAPGHSNPHTVTLESWEPGAVTEIGENDGWRVRPGQTLSITAEGFLPVTLNLN